MSGEKKKKKHRAKDVSPKSEVLLSSSTDDEDVNFSGFSCVKSPSDLKRCGSSKCNSYISEDEDSLACFVCNMSFHLKCTTFDKDVYCLLKSKQCFDDVLWKCKSCKEAPKQPTTTDLLQMITSLQQQFRNLQSCVKQSTTQPTTTNAKSHNFKPQPTMTHQIIVATDENVPFTQATFANKVKGNLKTVPIKNIRVAKDGNGVIDFPNPEARDEGISKLEKDFSVQANNRPQRSILPKLTISDIETCNYKEEDTEKLKEAICEKNPSLNSLVLGGKCFDIMFIKKDPRHLNSSYAVARVDKEVYEAFRKLQFKIYVDFGRCRISDRFRVIQCYGCQKFGHVKENCPLKSQNILVCRYCSGNHDGKDCSLKGNIASYKCANCSANHSSTYSGCPVLQHQVNFLAKRTQGLETFTLSQLRRHTIIT